ncbi:MAG: hypothetical protein HC794_09940 [Nitrospiraceae bacterium]|nr:hypothetical protein [Nitrospiraceae bacterium]
MTGSSAGGQALHVLYVCNDQAYFEAHRRWLADQAQQRGMAVSVACGAANDADIKAGKVQFPLAVERHRFLPFRDVRLMRQILQEPPPPGADRPDTRQIGPEKTQQSGQQDQDTAVGQDIRVRCLDSSISSCIPST